MTYRAHRSQTQGVSCAWLSQHIALLIEQARREGKSLRELHPGLMNHLKVCFPCRQFVAIFFAVEETDDETPCHSGYY